MKSVLMFPGQAELKTDKVSAILESREAADYLRSLAEVVGFDWHSLIGSEYLLNQTINAQLVQFLCSTILAEKLQTYPHFFKPDFLVGHSLGEYTTLHLAGGFDFKGTVRLIQKRASLLSSVKDGQMAWVFADPDEIGDILSHAPTVRISAINGPNNVTIAGTNPEFRVVVNFLRDHGFKVKVLGSVSVISHSPLLKEQSRELADAIHKTMFFGLHQKVVAANVAAEISDFDAYEVEYYLRRQLVTPVLWLDTVRFLWGRGVRRFIECGSSPFLGKLVERIYPKAEIVIVDNLEMIKELKL